MKNTLLSALATLTIATAVAQPWVSPNAKSYTKLSQYQTDFNNYWKGKPIPTKKGSGYKQFKRWENFWETRLMPDGTFPTAQTLWNNYQITSKAQTNSKQLAPANWVDIGPVNSTVTSSYSPGNGRTTVVVQNPQNANSLYVGTPAGGIFKSVNAGATWTCLSNQIASLGVSGIAVNASDTNQIFISTGDYDANDTYSVGVLQSNNNGATWNTTGNIPTYATSKLVYEPGSVSTLWLASADGMFKSTDNGITWNNVFSSFAGAQDFCFKPNDPNTIYVVNNTGIYTSTNGGTNFNAATITGTTTGSVNQYNRIAVTAANPSYVYCVAADGAFAEILRSADAGVTFNTQQSAIPVSSQGWYDMAVGASPTNADEVYFGILNLYQSLDGGVTGAEINSWSNPTGATYTHADIHSISYFGNNMYVCSDGGLYKSTNGANSFTDLSTQLPIAQIYRLSGSVYDKGVLAAGLQDNGGFCYTNGGWKIYNGGDGMDNAVNSNNPDIIYGMYQYGSIYRTVDGGLTIDGTFNSFAGNPNQGNWITPMQMDPKNTNRVLAGYEQVYEYNATLNAWLVLNNSYLTGGNISDLCIYPANGDIIYTTTGQDLYSTFDGGATWNNITTNLPSLSGNIKIEIHPTDSTRLWLRHGGYTGGSSVFYSNNSGATWTNITGALPNIPVNVIKYANDGTDGLYIGTDYGVYYNNNVLNNWIPFNTNLPNVIVRDLEINPTHDVLRAGTYGRGVWETNLYNPIVVKPTYPKPTADFSNNKNNICIGDSIKFSDKSSFATGWNWTFTGGSPATSILKNQTVTYATAGVYDVKLVVTGVNGTDSLVQNSSVTVGNNVLNFPFAENFESYFQPNGGLSSFYKITTNNVSALQWKFFEDINYNISGYGIDTVSVYIDNYVSAAGNISTLETPVYKMNNSNYVLKFDYAYNYYDLNSTDTLVVEYSTDCGVTYNQLWSKGGADLVTATVAGINIRFYPAANEWSTATINLTAIPLNADASFRFKAISDYGNLLYIDNINIANTVGTKTNLASNKKATVYPNPTTGEFSFSANLVPNQTYTLSVYNTLGQMVYTKAVTGSANFNTHINLSNHPKGMYSVTLTGNNTTQTQKLIVE